MQRVSFGINIIMDIWQQKGISVHLFYAHEQFVDGWRAVFESNGKSSAIAQFQRLGFGCGGVPCFIESGYFTHQR